MLEALIQSTRYIAALEILCHMWFKSLNIIASRFYKRWLGLSGPKN